jgi:hypothetical protein
MRYIYIVSSTMPRIGKSMILFKTCTPLDEAVVVYGSLDNWKDPRTLFCMITCRFVNNLSGCYKPHYCNHSCRIYVYFILNTSIPKGKHYYKLFDTKTNQWIEPTEHEKSSSGSGSGSGSDSDSDSDWEFIDGYWNRFFTL